MTGILEFIDPAEFVPLLVLIGLVLFITKQFTEPDSTGLRIARRASAAAFIAYAGLAIYAWSPAGASDLLNIGVRAALAAGTVYAVILCTVSAVTAIVGDPVGATMSWWRRQAAKAETLARERREKREQLEREKRQREDEKRMRPVLEQERRRQAEDAAKRERERHAKTDEARAEVMQFYDQHATLLSETLPPSLLKSQLQTRFPPSIAPAEAWQAARDMIAETLPLIAVARDQIRQREATEQEAVKRAEEEARLKQQAEERREAPSRLTAWYEKEKATIEARLPDGPDRAVILAELHGRYDQLIKQALQELEP